MYLLKKFQNYPDGQSCFFVDGVPLCGEEGEKAREEQRKFIERMISQQVKYICQTLIIPETQGPIYRTGANTTAVLIRTAREYFI